MGGWNAESDASELLSNLGVEVVLHDKLMKDIPGPEKVKVLLAQALFGAPDFLLLDEPTNDLDAVTATWLADFLADYKNTVIVISHDRYFLDMVCTHIVDIDFGRINSFKGNYTFWYESSQLMAAQMANKNKKVETKRKEMQDFIARFSANASKSKQATSRKKALEKLNIEDIKPSTRKYPFISFKAEREPGDQILKLDNLGFVDTDGRRMFGKVNFIMNKNDKIAILASDQRVTDIFYKILSGELEPTEGTIEWGQTITKSYLPNDNEEYFSGDHNVQLIDWLRQYSENKDEDFVRGFLGRMLFSGEEVFKKSSVLSGGEKVRCMLSKVMLEHPNFVLLNEPTNHLDLESITALNNGLKEFKGNFLMTTHDHELINSSTNRIIELSPNGVIDQLMPFDDYIKSDKIKKQREELFKGVKA